MRSYPLLVDGEDLAGEGWTYVADATALIREPRRTFKLKRALELGRDADPDEAEELIAGRCAHGSDDDNKLALEAAARAARELRTVDPDERREMGIRIHGSIEANREALVDVLIAEGHARRLAEWEVSGLLAGSSPETIEWWFDQADQRFDVDGGTVTVRRRPDGVVCVNPPQNAAGSNAALGIGALIAGNAVVVKAPKTSPLCVFFLYREVVLPVLREMQMPSGMLGIVSGYSKQITRTWLDSPLVDTIMYFGDSKGGLEFGTECLSRGKKPVLELSGNDAVVVWRDADLDAAARALVECFHGSGQICMVPKLGVVHPEVADALIDRVAELAEEIRPAAPGEPGAVLSPVLKSDRFFDVLGEAVSGGGEVVCGDKRLDVDGNEDVSGAFLAPTVVRINGLEGARDLRCVAEETFFPLLPIVVAEPRNSEDELLTSVTDFVDANPYGLRNSLWTRDEDVIDAFTSTVSNGGQLKVNTSHIGFLPYLATHGGTGLTGGPFGELHYPFFRTSRMQGVAVGAETPSAAGAP